MALRQLLGCLSRLSLQPVVSPAIALLPNVHHTTLSSARLLHTSAACQRSLDTRRLPRNTHPSSKNARWQPLKKMSEMYEYTVRPLPFPKTGGRGPNGRIWNHKRAGGHKRRFRMIDWVRSGEDGGEPLVERVQGILYDPNRSARIALVASGEKKRYIIATQHMKAGDLVSSSSTISKMTVRAKEGDSHPLGSLPAGTLLSCVELYPGAGGAVARSAGTTAQLVRKTGDRCVVRMPSKREISLSDACTATVGRVSNIDHNKRVIGKAGRNRWLGLRPNSGRWHRKDGRYGRKIRPMKKMVVYDRPPVPKAALHRLTF